MFLKLFIATIFLPGLLSTWSKIKVTNEEYGLMPDLFHFDDYEKCLHHRNDSIYCTVTIQLFPKNEVNSSKIWDIIQKVSSDDNNYRHDLLRHGICTSEKCSNHAETISSCLNRTYNQKYKNLGLQSEVVKMRCENEKPSYPIRAGDVYFIGVLGLYVTFVILVSIFLKMTENSKSSDQSVQKISPVRKFFSVFSLFDNLRYLLDKDAYNKENYMLFIQGIRVVTAIGVIVTHATEIHIITPVSDTWYTEEIPYRFITMIIANGGMTVQVYFVVSSWLLAVSFFEKWKMQDRISIVYVVRYIIRRFMRFTPAYALIVALHSTWLVQLSRGPFWDPIMGEDYRICRNNWWKNLLYFNNFVIEDGLCMFHSWYLAVDFQFTALGLLILWIVQNKPKSLFIVAGSVIAFQLVFLFYVLMWNNFEIAVVLKPEILYYFNIIYSKEWQATWTTTYSNLAGLVIGLCFGYLYTKHDTKIVLHKNHKIVWFILSWALILGPLVFSSYYMTTPYYGHTKWFSAAYGCVCKPVFALGVGLLIFGMSQGLGGIMKRCFEWNAMLALGNLSFGAYLVHFTLLKIMAASKKSLPYASDFLMVTETITNFSMSYLCSLFLTLFVLMPVAALSNKII